MEFACITTLFSVSIAAILIFASDWIPTN